MHIRANVSRNDDTHKEGRKGEGRGGREMSPQAGGRIYEPTMMMLRADESISHFSPYPYPVWSSHTHMRMTTPTAMLMRV